MTHLLTFGYLLLASCLAATRADKFPTVPPWTKTPPAVAGKPARSLSHRSAWFSANTAPAPSIQEPPYSDEAPTTKSNRFEDSVGAEGMNAKFRG